MEWKDVKGFVEENKNEWESAIKTEVKRRVVSQLYPYLIRLPKYVFWVTSFIFVVVFLALEVVVAGLWKPEMTMTAGLMLQGFLLAHILGFMVGWILSSRASEKLHTEIGEVLSAPTFNPFKKTKKSSEEE